MSSKRSKKDKGVIEGAPSSGPGSEYAYRRVWEINQLLTPKPHDFISTGRFYVKEGPIVLWDDKTRGKVKRYLFLFNDLLLFTIPKRRGKKFRLVIYMTLRSPSVSVEVVDNSSYNNEFRLHSRRKSFIFFAESSEDRKYWVKQLDASIKGTHPEENHTKAVHDQAKELVSDKKTTPVRPVHDDEEAEMTIYSSGSREDSEEEALPQPNTSSGSGIKIDFTATNPFASTTAASPFTINPFMTGSPAMTGQATSVVPGGAVGSNPVSQFGPPIGGAQMIPVPFAPAPSPFATVNPFMTGNPALGGPVSTFTAPPSANNPFATNTTNLPAINTANPFATVTGGTTSPFTSQPGVNPFATTNATNPFMTYH